MAFTTPVPKLSPLTRPFWEGTREGKLMLPKCSDCQRVHWYPRYICPHCHSMNIEWVEGSGKGTVHTFAVQYRAFGGWAEQVPFVTAYIDLAEGDRMAAVLRNVDAGKPESISVGMPVEVLFEEADDGTCIPFWQPGGDA